MEIKVSLNNLRVAPRKARLVVDLVRNKNVQDARNLLQFTVNKTSAPVLKLLNSAVASAVNDFKLEALNLYISKITVDEGPKMKRSFPMSRGRAYPIMKRSSRIALTLSEFKPGSAKKPEGSIIKAKPEPKKTTRKKAVKKASK